MCTITVDKWCGFVYANLIFICCSNLSCVRRAIHTADSDIVMASTRYNLHSFESTCQNNNVATSGISLKQRNQHHHKYIILTTVQEIPFLQFLITTYATLLKFPHNILYIIYVQEVFILYMIKNTLGGNFNTTA